MASFAAACQPVTRFGQAEDSPSHSCPQARTEPLNWLPVRPSLIYHLRSSLSPIACPLPGLANVTVVTVSSANRGAIIAYLCNFNILYTLWHYYSLLWRYYCNYCFANVQTIIHYYCIISKKTIIALMAILLFHILFSAYIIAIIAIITLLFTLFLTHSIMTIMFFEKYYCNYRFPSLLLK